MATDTAAAKVLGVVELLENVLSHMPCIDIMVAQRVSPFWKSTITNSPFLRTALFAPQAAPTTSWLPDAVNDAAAYLATTPKGYIKPHDKRTCVGFQSIKFNRNLAARQVSAAIAGHGKKQVLLNPFLHQLCPSPNKAGVRQLSHCVGAAHFYPYAPNDHFTKGSQGVAGMLLLLPPAKKVRVVCQILTKAGNSAPAREIVLAGNGQALTIGDVLGTFQVSGKGRRSFQSEVRGWLFGIEAVLE